MIQSGFFLLFFFAERFYQILFIIKLLFNSQVALRSYQGLKTHVYLPSKICSNQVDLY